MNTASDQREARLSLIRFLVSFGENDRAVTPKLPTKSVACPRVCMFHMASSAVPTVDNHPVAAESFSIGASGDPHH
jgi:hypothetical protein